MERVFIVASCKPWAERTFEKIAAKLPGQWHYLSDPADLNAALVAKLQPEYIFFPHWSALVPQEILQMTECVCFHMTDLPYGRGGSPLQNLIAAGHVDTMITALKMTAELDAGPVYLKLPLCLHGLAEEIYMRAAVRIAEMIEFIVLQRPEPVPQSGEVAVFKRRRPEQSRISADCDTLAKLFDHLRMLDAEGYPAAFAELGNFRLEFSRPALRTDSIEADVKITLLKKGNANNA